MDQQQWGARAELEHLGLPARPAQPTHPCVGRMSREQRRLCGLELSIQFEVGIHVDPPSVGDRLTRRYEAADGPASGGTPNVRICGDGYFSYSPGRRGVVLIGVRGGGGSGCHAQLAEDVADVASHGLLTDHKVVGDRSVGLPAATRRSTSTSRGVSPRRSLWRGRPGVLLHPGEVWCGAQFPKDSACRVHLHLCAVFVPEVSAGESHEGLSSGGFVYLFRLRTFTHFRSRFAALSEHVTNAESLVIDLDQLAAQFKPSWNFHRRNCPSRQVGNDGSGSDDQSTGEFASRKILSFCLCCERFG